MTTETAIVKVQPETDESVIALYEQAMGLQRCANELTITSDDDIKGATNDLSLISGLKKAIEEKRKDYIQPIRYHLDAINEAFKKFIAPFIQADVIYRGKLKEYDRQQEAIRVEQERINNLRIEAARAEMELKGELTESVDIIEVQPEQPKHYRAESGMLGKVDHWKCEVIDFNLLPNEYKIADMVRLRKVVTSGAREIPGVRIWNDPDIRVTAK